MGTLCVRRILIYIGMHVRNPLSHLWICKRVGLCVCVFTAILTGVTLFFSRPAVVTEFACKSVCIDWEVVMFGSPSFVKRGGTSGPHSAGVGGVAGVAAGDEQAAGDINTQQTVDSLSFILTAV